MGCSFSKLTNRAVILRNSFSGLYWMQCSGSLVFLLLGLCPCVGGVFREKIHGRYICWDLACLEKKISFHPHTFTFGHKTNLGKIFVSQNPQLFLQCLQASSVVTDKSEASLIHNLVSPTPKMFWNLTMVCLLGMDLFHSLCWVREDHTQSRD